MKTAFSNFFWRFAERIGAQLVTFIVSIVLARILEPTIYGTVALITVITTFLQVFVENGLGNALIQKKDADNLDFSTVFYTNTALCTVLYIGLFFAAPAISRFYHTPTLTPYIRVLGLTVIISGIKNVQQAYVFRHLMVKKFFFATLGGTIIAGIAGVTMALLGMGIWALVAQQVINLAIDTIILWLTMEWRPERIFSLERLKGLFSYGWKLMVSALLDTGSTNLCQLIVGKRYSSADLAQFNRGDQFPRLIVNNINISIDSILLPIMSNEQDDRERVKEMTRRSITVSTYIMAPMMIGLCCVGRPLILLVLTEKWLPSLFFLRVFCISYMLYPIHTANLSAIKAMGRSDLFLKLEIQKVLVALLTLLGSMWFGVKAIALASIVSCVCSQIINSVPNKKLLNYGYVEQLKDIAPTFLLAFLMGLCIMPISLLGLSNIGTILLQVLLGVAVYVAGSLLFKLEAFEYLYALINPHI